MKPVVLSKRYAAAIAVLAALAATGWFVWHTREPRYEGRAVSYWVEQLLHDNSKAREALRNIGPAAVPALARVVNRRRSRFWAHLETWRPKLPAFIARRIPNRALDQLLQERAIDVLYEFGPAAAPAVPALLGVDASLNDFIGLGSAGLAHATLLQIGTAGLPYFIEALKSGDPNIRAKAASYIGHLGPPGGAAAPVLAKALNDSSPTVRSSAVTALGQIGPPAGAAFPELKAALSMYDDSFRLAVIDALWKIGRESATTVPILIRILSDPRNPNRAGAATLLGELGPAARAAMPALTNVLTEEFSYTRVKAEEALRRMNVQPAATAPP
jgi:HEAT repeat protein